MKTVAPGTLTVRVFTGFSPFAFHRDEAIVGFDIDIVRSFAQAFELRLVLSPTDCFENIWLTPADGSADMAAAGIARFVERQHDDIAWSHPYYSVQRSILVDQRQAHLLRSIADFEDRAIAFVRGSTADLDTRARAPDSTRLITIEDQAAGMALLLTGMIDGLAMGAPSNGFNRQHDPRYTLIDIHEFAQPERLRFPVAASNPSLLQALNAFIATASASGEIARYIDRWDMHNAG